MTLIISAMLTEVNSAARIPVSSGALKNAPVQRIDQIHRERLKLLIKEAGSQAALSAKVGKSAAQISQWVNASRDSKTGKPRAMDRNTARLLETKCGKPEGWMDQPLNAGPAAAPAVGAHLEEVTDAEWAMLHNYRKLLDKDRLAIDADIASRAEERQAEADELFARYGVVKAVERANARRGDVAKSEVDPADPSLKQPLPLEGGGPTKER